MTNIIQRVYDFGITTIGHKLRTISFSSKKEEGSGFYKRLAEDPCDISPLELKAMRRRFDRVVSIY
tara:strand:- start:136 stop:333 length:198 start_codon:yes stop_codon:yes gene_type:complete